jgi:TRAP-type mannitol/chloroaromatic compound transport system substrate-binding protein
VQLRAFPQDVMEACYKAALDIYADLSNTNPSSVKNTEAIEWAE